MLDRPRVTVLGWGLLCLVLVGLLGVLIGAEWAPLVEADTDAGRELHQSTGTGWLREALLWVEDAFSFVPMALYTAGVALFMLLRRHRRAALFTVAVMLTSFVALRLAKETFGRVRPEWQEEIGRHVTLSYPSGHATHAAAFFGVCAVLTAMLVRRAALRHAAVTFYVVLAVVIALDRILLGRHYPTDAAGGLLLGTALVLLGMAAYSPLPRSHAVKAEPLPEVFSSQRRLAVVLNPVKVEDVAQFQAVVTQMALEAGWSEPAWYLTTIEDPGTGMAEAAAIAGTDLVLVCGGDGTVREVCAELAGTGIPVGIIPAGTGNLLARNLDIPLFLRAAIDVALNGQDRAIDLVEVTGDGLPDTHFMVMAGMGFDAAIMEGVNEDIKKRVGWLAYVISALKSLMFPEVKVEVSVDGGEFTKHRARTVVVGNVGYLQAGMPLLPDAAIDDGRLDVVLLHPKRFWSWLPLAFRVVTKRPRTDETINRMKGREVVIRASTETPRQLDGDPVGPGKELRMECLHGRVLVRVPR